MNINNNITKIATYRAAIAAKKKKVKEGSAKASDQGGI